MLTNIGLSELITHSLKEYETLIIGLATHPQKLKELKKKLEKNKKTFPLFDTEKYTKNLEKVYVRMITDLSR